MPLLEITAHALVPSSLLAETTANFGKQTSTVICNRRYAKMTASEGSNMFWDEPSSPEDLEVSLRKKYKHMSLSLLRAEARLLRIRSEGSPAELRDRLISFGLIDRFGKEAAPWSAEADKAAPKDTRVTLRNMAARERVGRYTAGG